MKPSKQQQERLFQRLDLELCHLFSQKATNKCGESTVQHLRGNPAAVKWSFYWQWEAWLKREKEKEMAMGILRKKLSAVNDSVVEVRHPKTC